MENRSIESLQEALNQVQAEKDALVSYLSHDFRAPSATILALAELQRDPDIALSQEEFLAQVENACHTTINSADMAVRLSRIKHVPLRCELINLQDLVEERLDYYQAHHSYQGSTNQVLKLHLKSLYPADADEEQESHLVYADRYWLNILLDHLLHAYTEAICSTDAKSYATMAHDLYLSPQDNENALISEHISLQLPLPNGLKFADAWFSCASSGLYTKFVLHSQPYCEKRVLLCHSIAQRLGGSLQVGVFNLKDETKSQNMSESLILSLPMAAP